ncbi:glycerol-3-phosphate dehydrogenase/oxidase [Vibrio sp. SCSIO 43132]|uniref:glycerol-3-phosphate dehydrogenase/oxidase n=1 Tax=Vibrio sp. SCSIO 43132 TaxID=2779363 RepID=UPI001CA8F417|nr:glycerol-3-phosphate dehydrogenase/oxidase [Vibrio sp. SCSIO 43132]UAB73189.1 glycerol-3-phosphate dehydrogenase/oxidase [Vibrio sp. SCSIO 43132]
MKVNRRPLESIENKAHFDAVVIGGGINGIATYRDLALQGLKVLLVEKDDFCSKASAAPSRMIHGGLRYLENAEFDLVKESLYERNRLLENAPHCVHPLRTHIPLTSISKGITSAALRFLGFERPTSERGALIVKLGLGLYDLFTRHDQVLPPHRMLSHKATETRWPQFSQDVKYCANYYDAWISAPERLAIELVKEANALQGNTHALNYVHAQLLPDGEIQLTDTISSHQTCVTTTQLINATGAWIDKVNQQGGHPTSYLSNTKGSHIIVDHPELLAALKGDMVYYENQENRVCIMFPYLGKVLIGSTDIPVSEPDSIYCTPEEVAYIIESVSFIFPSISIEPSDILYQFSGIRPLGTASKATAGQIPRSHQIREDKLADGKLTGYSLVGGKWTTFRAFAEQVTDKVLESLGKPRLRSTQSLRIGGGKNFPESAQEYSDYLDRLSAQPFTSRPMVERLLARYGTECEAMLSAMTSPEKALSTLPQFTEQELIYLIENEYVHHPLDLIQRRTSIAIEGLISDASLCEIITLMADTLDWDDQTKMQMHQATIDSLNFYNGLQLTPAEALTDTYPQLARNALCI